MQRNQPKIHRLSDYQVSDFLIEHVNLEIDLSLEPVRAKSRLTVKPNPECISPNRDLTLDGENMRLMAISLNGKQLADHEYVLTDKLLTVKNVPEGTPFVLETETELGKNEDLFGLYKTEGIYLVKAETEGLRRVLFCKDRPDVLAAYTTTIIANTKECPTLLSNGRLIKAEVLENGLHSATWEDTTPKPSYLFALVAGDFAKLTTDFITQSGRTLPIEFYVPHDAVQKCSYAMDILKKAMYWDEQTYGLECDLHKHMVTGVNKYASGASEPTGLNLFNTEFLFATPEMKTDAGFLRIAEVVSHEFFHYWTGDRVTIRDWHNLSLKEGLTTFRAAEFCESVFGSDLMRIVKGKTLDKGAPRSDSYTMVRSLYTSAAYEKSAEIFRMMKLVLGEQVFYKSMNQFLRENDGKAVTLEDLLSSLKKSSGIDLSAYLIWLTQPDIPQVDVTDSYDEINHIYTLNIKQSGLAKDSQPLPIPFVVSLFDQQGNEIYCDNILNIDKFEQTFQFNNVLTRPVPSLLRNFSAPVKLNYPYSKNNLLLLIQHDTNLFNRREAVEQLMTQVVEGYCSNKKMILINDVFEVYRNLLQDKSIDHWVLAEMLAIPSVTQLANGINNHDLDSIHEAREFIMTAIARELEYPFSIRLTELMNQPAVSNPQFSNFDITDASNRRLKNICLSYLSKVTPDHTREMALQLFKNALKDNMTDTMMALEVLSGLECPEKSLALDEFYSYWCQDISAINNWFRIQASSNSPDTIKNVRNLLKHPAFDILNPNKVFTLIGTFTRNPAAFHAKSGEGYKLLAEVILELDEKNPTLAARLIDPLANWERYDLHRQKLMYAQVILLSEKAKSVNVKEAVKPVLEKPFDEKEKLKQLQTGKLLTWMRNHPTKVNNKPENNVLKRNAYKK